MTSVPTNLPLSPAASARTSKLALAAPVIAIALFASGAAGLVNQVVWQRSLKVYLGGSESICSMIVVLVFMAGLGIGSVWMGRRSERVKSPLLLFGLLETILALVNYGIAWLLSLDLADSVFQFQKAAIALGVPLLALYAATAFALLMVPCLLMGATMPLAAAACQRNLRLGDSRLIGWLLAVNTLGAVLGTILASGAMIARLGLANSLAVAALLNLVAGLVLVMLARRCAAKPQAAVGRLRTAHAAVLSSRAHNLLAAGLGFCSLGYEMYLLRLLPLKHQPLPFTFAAVLAGFLLFWSIGAALSSRPQVVRFGQPLVWCLITVLASLVMFVFDVQTPIHDTASLAAFVIWKAPYFVPCLLFGLLFGLVTRDAAQSWGRDVGRIYGWNTAGSCAGVLATTLIGYELPFFVMPIALALLLAALALYACQPTSRRWLVPSVACVFAVAAPMFVDFSQTLPGYTMLSGRDGVILVDEAGNMIWDGLWHSKLSRDGDHIGTNNWYLAVAPALCHPTGRFEEVCVIGVATGITASTLAKNESVRQVDGYDISESLKEIYARFPAGTLGLAENPKINLIWQDARTGLALNPKQYALIQTQPLYLKQAGSGLLNSVEFFQLVQSRLKPDGVFCLYSNGTPEQAFAVRETADQVFRYRESFLDGYLVILSDSPLNLTAEFFDERLQQPGALWEEIRSFADTATGAAVMQRLDRPRLPAGAGDLLITDDRPLVEYPHYLATQVDRTSIVLPPPQQGRTHE